MDDDSIPFELPPEDGRSRSEMMGEVVVPRNGNARVALGRMNKNPERIPNFNQTEKALRVQARRLALDYSAASVINIYDMSLNAKDEKTRLLAARTILEWGIGKPSTIHISTENGPIIPNLTIVLGDGHQAIDLNEISEYVTDVKYTAKED